MVCVKWVCCRDAPSRVAPQDKIFHPVPAKYWDRIFFLSRNQKGDRKNVSKKRNPL